MKRYVHIGFNPGASIAFFYRSPIEKYLGENVDDWFRYASQNYVVWTDRDLTELAQGIKTIPGFNHFTLFLSEFSSPVYGAFGSGYGGLMPQDFWNWLQKPRTLF